MANINRWGMTDGMKLARTVGHFLRDRSNYTTEEFIRAAEQAAKEFPSEWVVFFSLGTKYFETGQYARALEANKHCVDIKPNDIRSTYALATVYRTLTEADLKSRREEFLRISALLNPPREAGTFDPDVAHTEITELGMVVDTAASQALRWFERSLHLNPDAPSRSQILWDLESMYKQFPHLRR